MAKIIEQKANSLIMQVKIDLTGHSLMEIEGCVLDACNEMVVWQQKSIRKI